MGWQETHEAQQQQMQSPAYLNNVKEATSSLPCRKEAGPL